MFPNNFNRPGPNDQNRRSSAPPRSSENPNLLSDMSNMPYAGYPQGNYAPRPFSPMVNPPGYDNRQHYQFGGLRQDYIVEMNVYVVEFKRISADYMVGYGAQVHQTLNAGDAVIVATERGENLGIITQVFTMRNYLLAKYQTMAINPADVTKYLGRIIRVASRSDLLILHQKDADERRVVQFCQDLAPQYGLNIRVVDAEYQFDREKLTIYYESHVRVDFRDYVKTLYSSLRVKVWMEKI